MVQTPSLVGALLLTAALAPQRCGGGSPGIGNPPSLQLSSATLTSKWFEGSNLVQIVEVTVSNTDGSLPLTVCDTLNVTVSSGSLNLVTPATVKRLLPGQQAVVQLGVTNKAGVPAGTNCSATITAAWGQQSGKARTTSTRVSGTCGFSNYTADANSVAAHQAPDWYSNAKYGIFIHWGLYSCPAYGSVAPNEDYAEWYWKRQHEGPSFKTHTYQYHQQTYGANFNYDDFMSNFTASRFNATEWLDLIAAAGARYFVPVTKHHDGFALFKTPATSSNRNSVVYGPKRDFLAELFTTAKAHYPQLRRGTYFSLPEWYHPEYAKYAISWGGGFPGGPPTNPYTGATVPYTGYVPVRDFVDDVQYPQMRTLAYDYGTEIMWCDIGGANNSPQMISDWLNWARQQGRQVAFNSRCGLAGDFDTPEYATNGDTVVRKWESNRGMDPFSYGYNYQTPDGAYLTGADIVRSLVDIVSKNGNFLLDIGPKNDGSIPAVMVRGLTDAGRWIKAHAESIFDTRFWPTTPGTGNFRYTTAQDAFYVHYMATPPRARITIPDRIPYLGGDKVTVVGGRMSGAVVPSALGSDGLVTLSLTEAMIQADEYVWTFKITY